MIIKEFEKMENNYNQDGFEEFLKSQLKNHRMYPKDSVWREINTTLHGEKRWPALTGAAVLLIGITAFICFHFSSRPNIFSPKMTLASLQSKGTLSKPNDDQSNTLSLFNAKQKKGVPEKSLLDNGSVKATAKDIRPPHSFENKEIENLPLSESKLRKSGMLQSSTALNNKEGTGEESNIDPSLEMSAQVSKSEQSENSLQFLNNSFEREKTDKNNNKVVILNPQLLEPKNTIPKPNELKESLAENKASLIESFKASRKPGKWSLLFYLAPSVSYRKLTEEPIVSKTTSTGPVSLNQVTDVKQDTGIR